jgi:hypothetical protein
MEQRHGGKWFVPVHDDARLPTLTELDAAGRAA